MEISVLPKVGVGGLRHWLRRHRCGRCPVVDSDPGHYRISLCDPEPHSALLRFFLLRIFVRLH